MNQDDSHSWVRISYGTVKYVNDSIEDDKENLADSQEEESVQTSSSVVAARSKAKTKPQPRESTGTTTIPLRERKWIDIEPSKQDLESYDLSKKVINLLRHNQKLHREEDEAIQFYKIKFHLRDHHSQIQNWSDDRWKACLAAGGGSKRRYQYCSDNLGSIFCDGITNISWERISKRTGEPAAVTSSASRRRSLKLCVPTSGSSSDAQSQKL